MRRPSIAASMRWSRASYTERCTNTREPAAQYCPHLNVISPTIALAARSKSASANTTTGDLPPSSSTTRFRLPCAEAAMIDLPTAVEPVKLMMSTPAWSASAWPALAPAPVTMFTTPSGMPTWRHRSPISSADSGASSAGLTTAVHPVANAAASFCSTIRKGAFQGVIRPATPIGSRRK